MFRLLIATILFAAGVVGRERPFADLSSRKSDAGSGLNDYPIIGVFTQPSTKPQAPCSGNCLYLAASYVKNLESAGARVVPINYYADEAELDMLFASLNGFFFVGGGAAYPPSAQYLFDKTVQANDAGDFAPLWGTCMGFQWLLLAATNNGIKLDPSDGTQMDAYNLSIPLDFASAAVVGESKLFGAAPADVMQILASQNVTMNNHHYGIYPQHFVQTPALASFYSVLSTNKDRAGTAFVSTIEAFRYPIFGSQWHPEKNPFEWGMTPEGMPNEAINHSPDAIRVAQYASNFFVQQARRSSHSFSSAAQEQAALIQNYAAVPTTGDFQQTYFFQNDFARKARA